MNLFGIGTGELLVIVLIVLVVMGPERLGEVARLVRQASGLLRHLRNVAEEFNRELNRELNLDDVVDSPSRPQRSRPPSSPAASTSSNTIAPPLMPQADQTQAGPPTSAGVAEPPSSAAPHAEPALADEPVETDHGR